MCDTQLIRKDGITFFAKNSDREPGEPQLVVYLPPVERDEQARVKTTYLEIPQTSKRFGVILSKPCWIWGAEMGINDQGVMIGNEAVFTRVHDRTPGLLGMDLLRLGLERGSDADHALEIITEHLQRYGQGGDGSFSKSGFSYDNSFIIADSTRAWVLETANRHWVASRVDKIAAISNCLTIGKDYQKSSAGLVDFARKKRLFNGKGELDFAKTFTADFYTFFSGAKDRLATSYCNLNSIAGQDEIRLKALMDGLRVHYSASNSHYARSNSDICMHACGYIRRAQTCGSMVARISAQDRAIFFTGSSAPCLSIFKPVSFDESIQFGVLTSIDAPIQSSLWYRHEQIHRRLILNNQPREQFIDREKFIESRELAEKLMLEIFEHRERAVDSENYRLANNIVMNWQHEWQEYFTRQPFQYGLGIYSRLWRQLNREFEM